MELATRRGPMRQGSLMATVTHVCTIAYVAEMLGEDQELLEAIVYAGKSVAARNAARNRPA